MIRLGFGLRGMIPALTVTVILSTFSGGAASAMELELEKELPSATGWRGAAWGAPAVDVARLFGSGYQPKNRNKNEKDAPSATLGELKQQIAVGDLHLKVAFGFDAGDRLNRVELICEKATKDSFEAARSSLQELYGDLQSQAHWKFPVGDRLDSLSWRAGNRLVSFTYLEAQPNILMTVRRFTIAVRVPRSETEFGEPGRKEYHGGVRLDKEGFDTYPSACVLELLPSLHKIRATCDQKVVVDKALTDEERVVIEPPGFHVRPAADAKYLFFDVDSEIVEAVKQAFPDFTQIVAYPTPQAIDKKLLRDVDSKHDTKPDRKSHSLPQAVAGKAVLVAIRPRSYYFNEGYGWGLQEKFHIDDHAVIVNSAGTYSFVELEPGTHTIVWQGASAPNVLQLNLEAGRIYYVRHGNRVLSEEMAAFYLSQAYPSLTERKPDK